MMAKANGTFTNPDFFDDYLKIGNKKGASHIL